MTKTNHTLGIEEEYFLVDLETRDLAADPPEALMQTCREFSAST